MLPNPVAMDRMTREHTVLSEIPGAKGKLKYLAARYLPDGMTHLMKSARRTSEGSNGKLTLGILIGNPNKRILYDIKCSVNCIYLKNEGDIVQIISETYLSEEVDHITNYFRFSFEIEGFPKTFWKHFLEKSEKYLDNDLLQVIVTGKANGLGGYFRTDRRYGLQDIIVDTHEPEKRFKKKVKNMISLKEKYRIDWKEFPKCIEAGEPERRDIINEIQNYCCLPPN